MELLIIGILVVLLFGSVLPSVRFHDPFIARRHEKRQRAIHDARRQAIDKLVEAIEISIRPVLIVALVVGCILLLLRWFGPLAAP